jgi:hypothetical protein
MVDAEKVQSAMKSRAGLSLAVALVSWVDEVEAQKRQPNTRSLVSALATLLSSKRYGCCRTGR